MDAIQHKERGQALVIIVLAIIGILGFAALAIDGGMVYAERRRAQNAADAAVFAAALAKAQKKTDAEGQLAAYKQATLNGFTTSGTDVVVSVNHPPVSGRYKDDTNFYQVIISAKVDPIFSHFIFSGTLRNTVEAVARAIPSQPPSDGNALHATGTGICKGIWFSGTGDTHISGPDGTKTNVFSNSEENSQNCQSGVRDGSGKVTINDGQIRVVGGFDGADDKNGDGCPDNITTNPCTVAQYPDVAPQDVPPLPLPDCSGYTTKVSFNPTCSGGVCAVNPGWYTGGIRWTGHDELDFRPGLYCIEGGIDINGGNVKSIAYGGKPEGVMFDVISGDVTFGGNGQINLNRADSLFDFATPPYQWGGMFLYMPYSNDGEISLAGGGNSTYTGTIYAPGPPHQQNNQKCSVGGNAGNVGLQSQVICYSIKITGTGQVSIYYDPTKLFAVPPTVALIQ